MRNQFRYSAVAIGLLVSFWGFSFSVQADELDPIVQDALKQTQQLLNSPDVRNAAISQNSAAQTVDAQVKSLAGNAANTEEIYKLSSEIFEDLVKETGGDASKLIEILAKAKDNPKSFYEHMSAKNRDALKSISKKIESQPTTTGRPK